MYSYRKPFIGAAFSVDISSNGISVNTIYTASYYPYIATSGMTEFSVKMLTGNTEPLSVYLNSRGSYSLKFWFGQNIGMMQSSGLMLTLVPESEVEQDLGSCKVLRDSS